VLILFKGIIVVYSDKTYVCTNIHTDINRYTYIPTNTACIRTYTHTYRHKYKHTYVHI